MVGEAYIEAWELVQVLIGCEVFKVALCKCDMRGRRRNRKLELNGEGWPSYCQRGVVVAERSLSPVVEATCASVLGASATISCEK